VVDCEAQDVQWKLTSKSQRRRKWSEEEKREKKREAHSMASKTSTDRKKSGDTTLGNQKTKMEAEAECGCRSSLDCEMQRREEKREKNET
jgi:hypothetical protein